MRTLALVLSASCSLMLACVQENPGGLIDGDDGAGASGTTTTSTTTSTTTGTTTGGEDAEAYFDANVKPILAAKCSGCHSGAQPTGPAYLGLTEADYYDTLVGDQRYVNAVATDSMLLKKGPHQGGGENTYFSDTEKPLVQTWLEMEATNRYPGEVGGTPTGPTGDELLLQFVGCMDVQDYIDANMPEVGLAGTAESALCFGCHQVGNGNNWMAKPNDTTLINDVHAATANPSLLNITSLVYYEATTVDGVTQNQLVQSCRWRNKGYAPGAHPKYILADVYQGYIDDWFSRTMTDCGLTTTRLTCDD